jgi:hypothetical protein
MKKKFSIGCILASIMLFAAGCSSNADLSSLINSNQSSGEVISDSASSTSTSDNITVSKYSSISIGDVVNAEKTSSGIIYKDSNGKYGVMSLDGQNDTGAIYTYADTDNSSDGTGYVCVSTKRTKKNVNKTGLIDSDCNEVLPTKYASISFLNDRYVKVITANSVTKNKNKALVYFTNSSLISLSPGDDDILYTGKWEIYDLYNKCFVKNVSGTLPYTITTYGSFIKYVTDSKKSKTVDEDGNEVTDGREILDDGSYILEKNGEATMYSTDDEVLFEYSTSEYSISSSNNDCYIAYNLDGSSTQYFIVDKTGEIISAKFDNCMSYVNSDLFIVEDNIYNYDGEQVIDGEFDYLESSVLYPDVYYTYNDDKYVIFDKDGNILYSGKKAESSDDINQNEFNISDTSNNSVVKFYNFTDKKFNISGTYVTNWLVSQTSNEISSLIDTRSGETILDNYASYSYANDQKSDIVYIFAYNSTNGSTSAGDFDVYKVNPAA